MKTSSSDADSPVLLQLLLLPRAETLKPFVAQIADTDDVGSKRSQYMGLHQIVQHISTST
jgi:hypothetical protein